MIPEPLTPVSFGDLAGWKRATLSQSMDAFRRSAEEILGEASGFRRVARFGGKVVHWFPACKAAMTAADPRAFFEQHFRPFRVRDDDRPEGLFTGYYEPLLHGSLERRDGYDVPVYGRPFDLVAFTPAENAATGLSYGKRVSGAPVAYDTRQQIESGSLEGRAKVVCWLNDWIDAFFMHVQGQGRVMLSDGSTLRLSYIAKSGHPYTGIGHVLIEQGVAPKHKMSMQVLRDWMRANPGEARALMWRNASYIFFQPAQVTRPELGGIGAAKVNLTPLYSLAVDRAFWMFGTPFWIETQLPPEVADADKNISRLMLAQDTGSAIKGLIRGDFFWGWGERAAEIAGHMKSQGQMTALLPLPLAQVLGHAA
jgi:membrane-bound lytic murein transglycosylase A